MRCSILIQLLSLDREKELRFYLFSFVQKSLSIQWGIDEWPTQAGSGMFIFLNICISPINVCIYSIASSMTTEVKEVGIRWWKILSQKSLLSNSISYWVIYSSNCLENGLFQGTKWHLKLLEKSNAPPSTRQSVLFSYVPLSLLSLILHPFRLLPRQQYPRSQIGQDKISIHLYESNGLVIWSNIPKLTFKQL